jgi:acetyl-CoA carboxylase carboxyl transferase subunit beta
VPEGLWHRCPACLTILYARDFDKNSRVCPSCGFHEKLSSAQRIAMLADPGSFQELDEKVSPVDALRFTDSKPYKDRIPAMQKRTGLKDAIRCGMGQIGGRDVSFAVMDFGFIGGSMGSVVGEKVTRAIERAIEKQCAVLTVVSSGGARMQESTYSLMQMAKTSAALAKLAEAGLPHICLLTNPSTAGVMASYGSLGDVILAEPDALIGFAGPRVIEQTIKQILPRGFQRSDFVKEHGFLDIVCHRGELRETIGRLVTLFADSRSSAARRADAEEMAASHAGNNSSPKRAAAKPAARRTSAAKSKPKSSSKPSASKRKR